MVSHHVVKKLIRSAERILVNNLVHVWAGFSGFRPLREDRGAYEYVSGPRANWDKEDAAYVLAECIFWPSVRASKDKEVFRHEMCHVRQSRKYGTIAFAIKYTHEHIKCGYENRFERSALRAERRNR